MSVLTCPVCRGAMREAAHGRVHIDICTKCRGVWLDRGELEKIAAAVGDVTPRRGVWDDDDDRDERPEQWDRSSKREPKRISRFLDFFD